MAASLTVAAKGRPSRSAWKFGLGGPANGRARAASWSASLPLRGQKLPMGSGRYWLGNHWLRQAVRMTTSPNLIVKVQTTFAERTMMKKRQRSALGHCIEGAPGRAS